ncbi:MAG TPA: NAD-dependent deacylase [Anaerolineae bacterium]|nr:NAD-dependent deacylase [Anaerolineae bacterium]
MKKYAQNTKGSLVCKAVDLLRNSEHAVVFTGAGISTPSGIPDFRSQETGLWYRFDPMQTASLSIFYKHPERFYAWLKPLAKKIWQAEPNDTHTALAKLEKMGVVKAIITQNIDRLHQKAGSKHVIELHGGMEKLICLKCGKYYDTDSFIEDLFKNNALPTCEKCQYILKPDIVLFEELLPEKAWIQADSLCCKSDLLIVIGSSLEVMPASGLPLIAIEHRAKLIINNLSATPMDRYADLLLPFPSEEIIPKIERGLIEPLTKEL